MSHSSGPVIVGAGMVTAVGLTAASSCAAIRAGVSPFAETHFHDEEGDQDPIIGAQVVGIGERAFGAERLAMLLAKAVLESLAEGARGEPASAFPMFICVAETGDTATTASIGTQILPLLSEALRCRLHPLSQVIPEGKTSFAVAVNLATQAATSRGVRQSIIAGVDSLLDADILAAAERSARLKTDANSNGFIPGEAAASVLIDFSSRRGGTGSERDVAVLGVGSSREAAYLGSGLPLKADGIVAAVRASMVDARVTFKELNFRLSDVNGEIYGFRENALAMSRLLRESKPTFPLWHCADSLGEVGAASGVALTVFGRDAIRRGYAPGPRAIVLLSSDSGRRSAFVLGRPKDGS